MKKIFFIAAFLFCLFIPSASQAVEPVDLYFFYGDGCPHCIKEEKLLEQFKGQYPNLTVHSFEVWNHQKNLSLLKEIGNEMNLNITGIPLTIIGYNSVSGYLNYETSGVKIKDIIEQCTQSKCPDIVGKIISRPTEQDLNKQEPASILSEKINLPIFGELDLADFSLPILTIIMGALDGFNPCAMWVLLFLITLLLGIEDRVRMWTLGTIFIVSSAAVYFVFMAAWLNLLLFIGFIVWIRIIIGLVALASGVFNVREFLVNKEGTCKVTASEKRQRIFTRLKKITQSQSFWLAIIGIILLAFAVNMVELVCSAGLPAVFTQILSMNNLSKITYYGYILLYIVIFMLDDLLVFIIAMVTLRVTGLTNKYSRYTSLIGGIVMLVIGILMLFKPDWLMFG